MTNCICHRCIRENDIKAGNGDDFFDSLALNAVRMILCPDCGNKRCPRASDHDLACTNSNQPGQEGSVYSYVPIKELRK